MNPLDVVNKYFNTISKTDGADLPEMVHENVTFSGPFFQANGAQEFITGMQRWIQVKKNYRVIKQFVEGNDVFSVHAVDITTPNGGTVTLDMAEWIEVQDGKIVKERVFFDPREYAKAFGIQQ